jgi:hypothetical protein
MKSHSNLDQLRLTCQIRDLNHEPRLGLTTFLKLYFYLIIRYLIM